ncbi:MAG: diguanylate cyclase [Candidatus Omnitrophota bacterium]
MRMIEVYSLAVFLLAVFRYFLGAVYGRVVFVVLWVFCVPLAVFALKHPYAGIVAASAASCAILYGIGKPDSDIRAERVRLADEERNLLDTERRYLAERERLTVVDEKAKRKEAFIVNLYEFTKRLSCILKFDEIFSEFGSFMREKFVFLRSELILIKKNADGKEYGDTFEVRGAETDLPLAGKSKDRPSLNYEELDRLVEARGGDIFIDRIECPSLFELLCLGLDVNTFAAVPLKSEKRSVAILTVENLAREELDDFMILSAQFALELKKVLLYETVENLAITDGLTHVYSRRYFIERIEEEIKRSNEQNLQFSFLMADIDHFKRCNDAYGHLVGDVVLKEIAQTIKSEVREIDFVSRYGGEEFSVLLPETTKEKAIRVAGRLREAIQKKPFRAYDESLRLTISIGVSAFPGDAAQVNDLIEKADIALYTAKRNGRNRVAAYPA